MELKEKLQQIIETASLRNYVKHLKTKHKDVLQELIDCTMPLGSDLSIPERVYLVLYPDTTITCKHGCRRKFNTLTKGYYTYCGSRKNCLCSREDHSKNIKEKEQNRTKDEKDKITQKRKQTCQEKHGVDNPMKLDINKEKISNSWKSKSTDEISEIIDKKRETSKNNFGTEHWTQDYNQTCKLTKDMTKARDEYKNQTGYNNPFQNPDVKEKIKNTNIEKYGVPNVNQKHILKETLEILNDKDKFIELYEKNSLTELSNQWEIDQKTTQRYAKKYGCHVRYSDGRSSYEKEIESILSDLNINYETNNRSILNGKELDFFLLDHNLAIEFCGLYWHSHLIKQDKKYHYNKWKSCNDQGIQLITIFEDEWINRKESLIRKIKSLVGINEKGIYARKAQIFPVSFKKAREFYNQYHLQGSCSGGSINVGAYDDNMKLIACMSFATNTRSNAAQYDLIRFCTDGRNHVGIASRLLKYFIRNYNPESIVSFADNRYSDGHLYEVLGFDLDKIIPEDYYWTDFKNRWHKSTFNLNHLKRRGWYIEGMSEREIMISGGYNQIYDCGKRRYIWKRTN